YNVNVFVAFLEFCEHRERRNSKGKGTQHTALSDQQRSHLALGIAHEQKARLAVGPVDKMKHAGQFWTSIEFVQKVFARYGIERICKIYLYGYVRRVTIELSCVTCAAAVVPPFVKRPYCVCLTIGRCSCLPVTCSP